MSSPASSATSASPVPPATPLTPNSAHSVSFSGVDHIHQGQFSFDALALDTNAPAAPTQSTTGPVRRKPSRRANTAERRATHNAVERQRRETLNGRFLDLAALLPNLASVRRPSKSAIVNSSIALIHTQRRSRATAARELRQLKLEADSLRAEVNEWRERAGMGLARVEEPVRSREFEELVSGGLEEAEESHLEEERRALEIVKEGLRLDAAMPQASGADLMNPFAMGGGLFDDEEEEAQVQVQAHARRPSSQGSNGHPQVQLPMPIAIPRQPSQPLIFDPNTALLQSHPTHNAGINYAYADMPYYAPPLVKPTWNTQVFNPGFLGGFGLRNEDDAHSVSTDSAARTPPQYAEAGDAFNAGYVSFPTRVAGGGSVYNAAMGLFM